MKVYIAQASNGNVKIGKTANLSRRMVELRKYGFGDVRLLGTYDCQFPDDLDAERRVQVFFDFYRIGRSEWFRPECLQSFVWTIATTIIPGFERTA